MGLDRELWPDGFWNELDSSALDVATHMEGILRPTKAASLALNGLYLRWLRVVHQVSDGFGNNAPIFKGREGPRSTCVMFERGVVADSKVSFEIRFLTCGSRIEIGWIGCTTLTYRKFARAPLYNVVKSPFHFQPRNHPPASCKCPGKQLRRGRIELAQ